MAHFFNFLHTLSNPALSSRSAEESAISGPMSFRTYGYHKMLDGESYQPPFQMGV